MGEIVAFLSGKGGTGKTSVCAGVATALAREGLRVLCIDCDVGLRNLDIALGLADTASLSFMDICKGDYIFEQINHYPKEDAKKHFKALNQKLLEGVDALFVRLSGLTK